MACKLGQKNGVCVCVWYVGVFWEAFFLFYVIRTYVAFC